MHTRVQYLNTLCVYTDGNGSFNIKQRWGYLEKYLQYYRKVPGTKVFWKS